MRIFYALYAFAIIFLAWRFHGTTEWADYARKATLALWCVALLTVLLEWKYARWMALAAFVPLGFVLVYEIAMHALEVNGLNLGPSGFVEAGLLLIGGALFIWLATGRKI